LDIDTSCCAGDIDAGRIFQRHGIVIKFHIVGIVGIQAILCTAAIEIIQEIIANDDRCGGWHVTEIQGNTVGIVGGICIAIKGIVYPVF
jgi:hypothetical protein